MALGFDNIKHKIEFTQGDACNLKKRFAGYDLVFAGNLIDRLYHPALFLKRITSKINPNGYLVLTSPYTWLADYTERDKWLGGTKVNGENVSTLDGLINALADTFVQVDCRDIPFVIRETARKYQHTIAQMTIWKKR